MHERNGRIYKLNWLMDYQNNEAVAKFMAGSTIIESRVNRGVISIGDHLVKSISYVFSDRKAKVPENAMLTIPCDYPSFMVEKNGKEYVIAIDPILTGWMLMEVEYID